MIQKTTLYFDCTHFIHHMSRYSTISNIYKYMLRFVNVLCCFVLLCLLRFHVRLAVTVHMTSFSLVCLEILVRVILQTWPRIVRRNYIGVLVVMVSSLKFSFILKVLIRGHSVKSDLDINVLFKMKTIINIQPKNMYVLKPRCT